MSGSAPLGLFAAYGVEIELMIVSADTLDVLPASDVLLRGDGAEFVSEIERGALHWSNELVLHVLELKTARPAPNLAPLAAEFQRQVREANALLAPLGGRLMPTAMHPWMAPDRETRVWPHEYSAVYEAFNRIFDCRGHGWSNLQSVHINLPFSGDEEFARLHAAIRLLLPLLPALAASSPLQDGRRTGLLDTRLETYRTNARRIPEVTGYVVPETVRSAAEYDAHILQPMYRAIAPLDPAGVLQEEFLNARGAIARFDRGAIEIRVLDVQEHPAADLAIVRLIVAVLQSLVNERWSSLAEQQAVELAPLHALLLATIRDADAARVEQPELLRKLGWHGSAAPTAGELWSHLAEATGCAAELGEAEREALACILRHGPLARRIVQRLPAEPAREHLVEIFGELCRCLDEGVGFY